jgi:hypothetical protein
VENLSKSCRKMFLGMFCQSQLLKRHMQGLHPTVIIAIVTLQNSTEDEIEESLSISMQQPEQMTDDLGDQSWPQQQQQIEGTVTRPDAAQLNIVCEIPET